MQTCITHQAVLRTAVLATEKTGTVFLEKVYAKRTFVLPDRTLWFKNGQHEVCTCAISALTVRR